MFVYLILRKYSHLVFWTQIELNMIQVLVALASSVNRYFTLWLRENSVLWGHFAFIFQLPRLQGPRVLEGPSINTFEPIFTKYVSIA